MSGPESSRVGQVLGGMIFFIIFISIFGPMWTGMGMGSLLSLAADDFGENADDPTLSDYDAVTDIEHVDKAVAIHLSERPHFASTGTFGEHDVTHLHLTRADGRVNRRVEYARGVTTYRFDATDQPDGQYTLTLIHYEPPRPGLFGTSEKEYEQTTTFTIEDGEVTSVDVPWSAIHE